MFRYLGSQSTLGKQYALHIQDVRAPSEQIVYTTFLACTPFLQQHLCVISKSLSKLGLEPSSSN